MVFAGLAVAGVAALLHVYIFYMESIAWTSPRVRATFDLREEEAAATKELAFNQGFYNLFLAVIVAVGIVVFAMGSADVGISLVFAGTGSMAAAALVLLLSSRGKHAAALKQGILPWLTLALLAVGLIAQ